MKKIFNEIIALIPAVTPVATAGIFSVLIYNEFQNFWGLIICLSLLITATWIGIIIFKTVQRTGFIDFITLVSATPDLDNLEPTKGSRTKKRTAQELAILNKKDQHLLKGGAIKIFGDWFNKPYENAMKITKLDYDDVKKQMIIRLNKTIRIIVDTPDHILESPTVLKIISAKKVHLEFQGKRKGSNEAITFFKTYTLVNNIVITDTNIEKAKYEIDAFSGHDALILFGEPKNTDT